MVHLNQFEKAAGIANPGLSNGNGDFNARPRERVEQRGCSVFQNSQIPARRASKGIDGDCDQSTVACAAGWFLAIYIVFLTILNN